MYGIFKRRQMQDSIYDDMNTDLADYSEKEHVAT